MPTLYVDARRLQLLLGLADRGDFRAGIDDAGNDVVIHMPRLAGQHFGQRHAFILGLVRQHRAADDIADGIDAGHIGFEMLADLRSGPWRRA